MNFPVAINGRFLTRQPTGIDRFAAELLGVWLKRQGNTRDVRLLVPASSNATLPTDWTIPPEPIGRHTGHLWEQLDLPRHCRDQMLLNMCNSAPLFKKQQLAVVHDASFLVNPSHFSLPYRTWYRFLTAELIRNASVIATVSKFSAAELMRFFGVRSRGIEVIYESGEHILRSASDAGILSRLNLVGQRYVLAVGSRTLNKNFSAIVKAAESLVGMRVKVVAAGGSNSRVFAGAPLQADNLVLAGYVSNEELRALYENADCFVFPSFYEGFGLPPLEAMHCGCPVLVSRRGAIPEVCGEAAAYCDPESPSDIAQQLVRILSSSDLRSHMREAGYDRVKLFTWGRAADTLQELLHSESASP
ncbi:MAG: glycosyltransferase family 1 protein [Gammaproteobacteria bacterium]